MKKLFFAALASLALVGCNNEGTGGADTGYTTDTDTTLGTSATTNTPMRSGDTGMQNQQPDVIVTNQTPTTQPESTITNRPPLTQPDDAGAAQPADQGSTPPAPGSDNTVR